ncbi:hypothetical protein [Methylobacterium radiodurans]|uniref:Uncharacterized protein n=1 Tax=Methylobacterium radiodurans TaxID=2202828 RepID=A0A2U8VMA6_9HYPH|nr:hypothetical protein [Methylobacterium radiodurans]AWN34532.1 hypothetical protein DK427_01235 [Methylobacterium radiodurans]
MIETLMIFALGFLAASLGGLLLLPVLNARAARLARRRAEALVPLAPAEIAAERDFLRARFAVQQRRMERTVETVRARRQADMAAIGARTVEAARLARDLARREGEVAEGLAHKARLEGELETARDAGAASLATLQALEEAHADLLDSLLAARRARPSAGTDSAEADEEREVLQARLSAAEDALAQALSARESAVERENADLRARIADLADSLAPSRERLPVAGAFPAAARG